VDVDPGDDLPIPAATGHYETTMRPIGLELAERHGFNARQKQQLRESTMVGILVIGMEEDAVPSTEVINETRDELVRCLQKELDKLIRGITISWDNPAQMPNLVDAVAQIQGKVQNHVISSAKSKGIDELVKKLMIPGFPPAILAGAANADDFIGAAAAVFTYEQILNAGDKGLPIKMTLNQNPDEELYYRIEGRIFTK